MSYPDYSQIDPILSRWAEKKGYRVQTQYKDAPVRCLELWSDDGRRKAQIGITKIDSNRVEVVVFDGKKTRKRLSKSVSKFRELMDEAEVLALGWIAT